MSRVVVRPPNQGPNRLHLDQSENKMSLENIYSCVLAVRMMHDLDDFVFNYPVDNGVKRDKFLGSH